MDIRAEFEAWFDEFDQDCELYAEDKESHWQAWQAATEAARGGDVEPVMYVNEGQIKAARKMRSRGKDVGYVAFSLPNEGFNPVPLYTHQPAPMVPEGWAVWESSGMGLTENAMVVQHPSGRPRRFFHNNDKGRLMYDFLKAMLNAAPEPPNE